MLSTKNPILYENLKEGVNPIAPRTISLSNPDGSFSITVDGALVAILYFNGTVRLYSGGVKKRITKNRVNSIIKHFNKKIVIVEKQWYICDDHKHNVNDIAVDVFVENVILNP